MHRRIERVSEQRRLASPDTSPTQAISVTAVSGHRLLSRAVLVAVLVLFAGFLIGQTPEVLSILGRVSPAALAIAALLRAVAMLAATRAGYLLFLRCAPQLGFSEFVLLSVTGLFAGNFAPGGSTLSKGGYLKLRHQVPVLTFTGLHVTWLLGILVAGSLVALCCLLVLAANTHVVPWLPWLVAATGLAAGLLPAVLNTPVRQGIRGVPRLQAAVAVWRQTAPARLLMLVWPWLMLRAAAGFAALGVLLNSFDESPFAFLKGGIIEGLSTGFNLVRIIPGNFGLYEAGQALIGAELGIAVTMALTTALIYRMLGLLAAGLLSILVQVFHRERRG